MLKKCPHHELPVWRQVQTFYNGVTLANRATIDAAAGGTIMKKLPSKAFNIIDEIATNLYSYGQERADKRAAGIHSIDAVSTLSAQMNALTHKMDNLGAAIWNGAPMGPCGACGQIGHLSQDCKVGNPNFINEDANFVSHGGSNRYPTSKSGCLNPKFGGTNRAIGKHSLWKKEGQLPSDTENNPMEHINAITLKNDAKLCQVPEGSDFQQEEVGEWGDSEAQ
ncbi:UNVERIFIED_CONTAM: hypothetical protein Slati_2188400 [Sesamum latifolium]|uniref:CCHC-type domain-containing protein n=1 Tax=Sesamum latifolium TaxID=2727402 RepID=A0AAW2WS18_9LAMI